MRCASLAPVPFSSELRWRCLQLEQQRMDALLGLVNAANFDLCGQDLFFAGNYFVSRLGEPTIVFPVAGFRRGCAKALPLSW